MRFLQTLLIFSLFSNSVSEAQNPKVQDAKNKKIKVTPPKKDPELAKYHINRKTSPRAKTTIPVETTLPLQSEKGTRIALIGNLLLDAERRYGHFETLLHQNHPNHQLTIPNLAWPADEFDLMPRPDHSEDLDRAHRDKACYHH